MRNLGLNLKGDSSILVAAPLSAILSSHRMSKILSLFTTSLRLWTSQV